MIWTVPNLLTVLRLAAAPGMAICFIGLPAPTSFLLAFVLFVLASATDWVDGYLARAWNQQSALGEMLDPIADKAIVLITLTSIVGAMGNSVLLLVPAAVIIFREVLVSGLREYVAGRKLQLKVTRLAKYKTATQMVAIGGLMFSRVPSSAFVSDLLFAVSLGFLWAAAALTLVTGWDYFRKSAQTLLT